MQYSRINAFGHQSANIMDEDYLKKVLLHTKNVQEPFITRFTIGRF